MHRFFLPVILLIAIVSTSHGQEIRLELTLPVSEDFYFGAVTDMSVLPNGTIIVLDSRRNQLLEFSVEGMLLDTIATEGKGPGELAGPLDLTTGPKGKMAAYDISNARITFWDSKGEYIREYKQPGGWGAALEWNNNEELVFRRHPFRPDENGNRVISFATINPANGKRTKEGTIPLTSQFDSRFTCVFCRWTLTDESTIITGLNDTEYRFYELTMDGERIRSWSREIEPVRYSEEELEALKQKREQSPVQESKDRPLPTYKNWFRGFEIDSMDRVWVQVATKDGLSAFDIFDRSGKFLQRITIDREVKMLEIQNGFLLARTDDPSKEYRALLYNISDIN